MIVEHEHYQLSPTALAGKVILITGAAGGLGSSLARIAATQGCELILLDKNERGLNTLHDEIEQSIGKQPGLYPLDLSGATVDDYHELADRLQEVYGELHGLVHCAASLGQITPVEQIKPRMWLDTFTVNLHAPFLLTQAVLPLMRQTGNASLIFTLDEKQKAYWGAYGVSKAAIESMVKTLADEFDTQRNEDDTLQLTCNAINPGKMRTTFRTAAFPGEDPNTLDEPSTKVGHYLYLLSDLSRYINGHLITL